MSFFGEIRDFFATLDLRSKTAAVIGIVAGAVAGAMMAHSGFVKDGCAVSELSSTMKNGIAGLLVAFSAGLCIALALHFLMHITGLPAWIRSRRERLRFEKQNDLYIGWWEGWGIPFVFAISVVGGVMLLSWLVGITVRAFSC